MGNRIWCPSVPSTSNNSEVYLMQSLKWSLQDGAQLALERIKAITNFSTIFLHSSIIKLFPVLIYNLWALGSTLFSSESLMSFSRRSQAQTALLDLGFGESSMSFPSRETGRVYFRQRKKQEQRQRAGARHFWKGFAITCCGWSPGCMQGMRERITNWKVCWLRYMYQICLSWEYWKHVLPRKVYLFIFLS